MGTKHVARLLIATVVSCVSVLVLAAAADSAATQIDPTGVTIDLGPAPVAPTGSCPFDQSGDASLYFLSGHAVMYGTVNKNGDWGGGNIEGTAVFFDAPFTGLDSGGNPTYGPPVPYYVGHVHFWFGGGNNIQGQSESGYTLSYNGSGLSDPSQWLKMNLSGGYAQPAHSTAYSTSRNHGSISCG